MKLSMGGVSFTTGAFVRKWSGKWSAIESDMKFLFTSTILSKFSVCAVSAQRNEKSGI